MKRHLQFHRLVRLRRRYLFTRHNRLRLRYIAGTAGAVCALFVSLLGLPSVPLGWDSWDQISVIQDVAFFERPVQEIEPVSGRSQDEVITFANLVTQSMQSQISNSIRKASLAIQKVPDARPRSHSLKIGSGDTVAGLLQSVGITGAEAVEIVAAMRDHFDPRQIQAGQNVDIMLQPASLGGMQFQKLSMRVDPMREVSVERKRDSFVSKVQEKDVKKRLNAQAAEIQTSLYGSATRAGIPASVIAEVIRAYSWNVDFQRDIRQGDKIEVMYDSYETDDGYVARTGNVVYANLSVAGRDIPIYRFETKDGFVDYFEPNGQSVRKTLMKTPVDGARISSGYGMRKHPILGYNKMHKGVDFAAPTGTPVYAAGNGTIDFAGRKSGYGNYLSVKHNSRLKTAYAHLYNFARGIKNGSKVKQGQIIAYVGSTGRATGPHLHYEVLVNGRQVNPSSVDLPTGEILRGNELKRFKGVVAGLRQQFIALTKGVELAENTALDSQEIR